MTKAEFTKFLDARAAAEEKGQAIDWNARREFWISQVDKLYSDIEEQLAEFVVAGRIKISKGTVQVSEQDIGTYFIGQLVVELGSVKVFFTPKGTNIFGASGRVDISGPRGIRRLVLVDKLAKSPAFGLKVSVGEKSFGEERSAKDGPVELAWKFATNPPRIQYTDFDGNSLFQAIIEVASSKNVR